MKNRQQFLDMEAKYRKQADAEPEHRKKHLACAEAWQRLSDTASLFDEKQYETKELLASLAKTKIDSYR